MGRMSPSVSCVHHHRYHYDAHLSSSSSTSSLGGTRRRRRRRNEICQMIGSGGVFSSSVTNVYSLSSSRQPSCTSSSYCKHIGIQLKSHRCYGRVICRASTDFKDDS